MKVKILGSAAGGAFPQWNCACPNCSALRAGSFSGKARTQTQVAISNKGNSWFLLGASPDLRVQIERTPELHPREGLRQSPIAGVVLANADVDHVLGLLLLRELQPLRVYAAASVRRILTQDNSMFEMLHRLPKQISWNDIQPRSEFELSDPSGEPSGIKVNAGALSPHYPAYVNAARQSELSDNEASLGFFLQGLSGARMAYLPAVPAISEALLEQVSLCDVLLFDGTFFTDDELMRIQGGVQSARQMGHVPVEDTITRLAGLSRPRKIFLHINNTNPMLEEGSPPSRQVRDAGWEVAEDGWEFDL